jgi:uncharacterized membrane protein
MMPKTDEWMKKLIVQILNDRASTESMLALIMTLTFWVMLDSLNKSYWVVIVVLLLVEMVMYVAIYLSKLPDRKDKSSQVATVSRFQQIIENYDQGVNSLKQKYDASLQAKEDELKRYKHKAIMFDTFVATKMPKPKPNPEQNNQEAVKEKEDDSNEPSAVF